MGLDVYVGQQTKPLYDAASELIVFILLAVN